MRLQTFALVAPVLMQLCACQMMTGLNELEVESGRHKGAQVGKGPTNERGDASVRDAGEDGRVAISMGGPADRGDLEHEHQMEPEREAHTDSDAGIDPSDRASEAAASDIPSPAGDGAAPPAPPVKPRRDAHDAGMAMPEPPQPDASEPSAPPEKDEPACVSPPPGGPVCAVDPQCGCEAGENCAVDADRLTCVSGGKAQANERCDGPEDCIIGYQCLSGACLKLCDASLPDCSAGAACLPLHTREGDTIEGAHVCESNCNLVEPEHVDHDLSACGPGLICVWSGTGSYCAHSDHANQRHGEQCAEAGDCAPGYVCTEQGTCAKWCVASSDCPDAFSCGLDATVQVGETAFGTCQPDCLGRNEYVCGLSTQCGCADDRSCDTALNRDNQVVRECRELGSVPAYGHCTTSTDCGRSAQCVAGECRPTCASDFECDRYARCEPGYFASAPFIAAGATCHRPCDPADPVHAHGFYGSCEMGQACDVTADGASQCRAATPRGVAGVSCNLNSDCAVGFTCTTEHACVALCRGNADCQVGTCRAFVTSQFATTVEWGYCATGS